MSEFAEAKLAGNTLCAAMQLVEQHLRNCDCCTVEFQALLDEVADETLHAQFLANKIVALGGEPTTTPNSVPPAADNREMLEAVLVAEKQAMDAYGTRAKEAEAFGDKALAVQLEDMLRDESGHSEETERMLRDWPV